MELIKYLFLFILFLWIVGCAQDNSNVNDNDKIIARIGSDYEITFGDLKQYAADWNYSKKYRNKPEAYKIALDPMINNQLKRFDFFERKLNENHDLMRQVRPALNYALINTYFEKKFVDKYVDEKTAAEVYEQMEKEVIISDLLLPVLPNLPKEKIDSLQSLALEIEKGVINNYDINELIRSYSLKNSSLNRKNISWTQSMSDPVANSAFKLHAGDTRVIRSGDGFHIIKVLDIKPVELEPFEEIKDEIISELKKGYYQAYNNEYENFRYGLIDRSSVKWNQSALDQLIKWSKNQQFYAGVYKDTIRNAISNGRNFEILSYDKGRVDLKEYLRLLEEVILLSPNTVLSDINVKEFILDAVYDDNVIKDAQKTGLEKEIINPYTKNNIVKDRIIYLYNLAVIEGSIPEATPEALQKFYEEQKDSLFYQLKKVIIYTRIYSDSTKAAEEIEKINSGISFEKYSNRWFVKTFIRERDGSLKSFRSQEPPYLAEASYKLGLNEVAGPIEFYEPEKGRQFAVIKCFKIEPEKQLTFDEVKGKRIVEEFQNYYRQKISNEVDEKLRKKYGVEIFEDEFSRVLSSAG